MSDVKVSKSVICEVFSIKDDQITIVPSGFKGGRIAVFEDSTGYFYATYINEEKYLEMKKESEAMAKVEFMTPEEQAKSDKLRNDAWRRSAQKRYLGSTSGTAGVITRPENQKEEVKDND